MHGFLSTSLSSGIQRGLGTMSDLPARGGTAAAVPAGQRNAENQSFDQEFATAGAALAEGFDENDPASWGNPGRNDPCPCGSGKKFKHCHGRLT